MKAYITSTFLAISLCLVCSNTLSDDISLGKAIAEKNCATCHGLNGQAASGGNSAITPNLSGQQKEYMIAKLKDYKSGKLQDSIMNLMAGMLSIEDIKNVSEWYSSIELSIKIPKE